MKEGKIIRNLTCAILVVIFAAGCATKPGLTGKWQEIGKTATLELSKDGTFEATDNQKMSVVGKYALSDQGDIRFVISRPGYSSEIITGTYSVQGDILNLTSADGKEVQRYRRQK